MPFPLAPQLQPRRLWQRARREVRAWISPARNPFLALARRIEARGGSLWRLPILIGLLWAFPMLLEWLDARDSLSDSDRDWANEGALYWIGVTLIVAGVARLLRCDAMLRVEVVKDRFEPWQLIPLDAARRAWLWCAPPTLFALNVCALAVPALAWGMGDLLGASDALGLLILALLVSWGRPSWRFAMWRGQLQNSADASNRHDGFAAPNASHAWPIWFGSAVAVGVALATAGVGGAAPSAYWDGLPVYLRATGDEFWRTWPLFAARWLMLGQPFFGFELAPVWLVLPLWAVGVHNGVLRLGAVTAAAPFWTAARVRRWHAARGARAAITVFLALGFLWPGAINGAWLGAWFEIVLPTRDGALAAWWVLMLALGTLVASGLAEIALSGGWDAAIVAERPLRLGALVRDAITESARGTLWAPLLWAGACALGGAWPLGAAWRAIAPASLAVAMVWLGALGATFIGGRVSALRKRFKTLHLLWFYGAPACLLLATWLKMPVEDWLPAAYLWSPWTLWLSLRDLSIGANSLFWRAILVHGALIGACALIVWRQRDNAPEKFGAPFSMSVKEPRNEASIDLLRPPNPSPIESFESQTNVLFQSGAKANSRLEEDASPAQSEAIATELTSDDADIDDEDEDEDEYEDDGPEPVANGKLGRPPLPAPNARLQRVLDGLERFDNPLLRLEARRVIGNAFSGSCEIAWAVNVIAAFVLVIILPIVGLINREFPLEFLGVALTIMLLIWCVVPFLGLGGTARAYDLDRMDGSLQALFLAPRTETEIAWGKLGPYLVRGALMMLIFGPLWLAGMLAVLFGRDPFLIVVLAVAPLLVASFALRIAALSHWIALVKRRVGTSQVPLVVVVPALILVPCEICAFGALAFEGALAFGSVSLILSALWTVQAWGFWRLGLRALRRQRLGGAALSR